MRFMFRCAIAIGLSVVVFEITQLLGGAHCYDCGASYGFPLSYMQEGTYASHGHVLGIVSRCQRPYDRDVSLA
jgi:hypothetical protein